MLGIKLGKEIPKLIQGLLRISDGNNKILADLETKRNQMIEEVIQNVQYLEHTDGERIERTAEKACDFINEKIDELFNFIDSNGYRVGIFGTTHAGKSSLINAIFEEKVAEVAERHTRFNKTTETTEYKYRTDLFFIDTLGFSGIVPIKGYFDKMFKGLKKQELKKQGIEVKSDENINIENYNKNIDIAIMAFSEANPNIENFQLASILAANNIPTILLITKTENILEDGETLELFASRINDLLLTYKEGFDFQDNELGFEEGTTFSKISKLSYVSSKENYGIKKLMGDIDSRIDLIKLNRRLAVLKRLINNVDIIAELYLNNMDGGAKSVKNETIKTLKSKNGLLDKPLDQKDTANIKKMFSDIWKSYGEEKEIRSAENPDVISTFGQVGRGIALTISLGISYWALRDGKDTLLASECDKLADECIRDARENAKEKIKDAITKNINSKIEAINGRITNLVLCEKLNSLNNNQPKTNLNHGI